MEVKTYFNGAVTQNQLISMIIASIAVILILSFAKKVLKLVLISAVVTIALVYFGVVSPEKVKDLRAVVKEQGVEVFNEVAELSNSVKVDTSDDDVSVQVLIEDKWYDINDISSFIKSEDGIYSVSINGKDYAVKDEGIIRILDLMKK